MRQSKPFGGRAIDLEILRRLDQVARRGAVTARDIAESLGVPTPTVTGKVQSLVKAGLARRLWGPDYAPGRTYAITDEGRDHLMRADAEAKSSGSNHAA